MQRFKYLSLFAVCSLLLSCRGAGPAVTICLIDSDLQELQCGRPDGSSFVLPLDQANNYACLSNNDFQTLVTYIKEKCSR